MTAWPQPNPKTEGTQMAKQRKKSNKKRCNGKGFKANGAAVGKIDALQAKKPGQVTQCAMFEDECYILFNLP